MILTESGEVGIYTDASEAVLRPSLYAISRIGTPREIVELFAVVMSEGGDEEAERRRISAARNVIYCCGRDEDRDLLFRLFGHLTEQDEEMVHVPGEAEADILPLARCLLKHGVTGALPAEKQEDGEYSQEFNAREYVAVAMAHLGASEREAWEMTMTGLVGALRAKFPPQEKPGSRAPGKEEMEATLEWHDRVLAARKAKLH